MASLYRCVEMLINEQIRRYNETMEKIKQVESAEADAHNQLKLKRQNTVSNKNQPRSGSPLFSLVLLLSFMPGFKGQRRKHLKSLI